MTTALPSDGVAALAVPGPTRLGQGTAVEQSRAAAEVVLAAEIAQRSPRDLNACVAEMEMACRQMGLAQRAFYTLPVDGQEVVGPTIHLARELARIWRHLNYGVVEMLRDDDYHQSEMRATCWDMQSGTINYLTFIVPHRRDRKNGAKTLTSVADVYNNNANQGAKRVRGCIYAVLPKWFTDRAEELCRETLVRGEGEALERRRVRIGGEFAKGRVTVEQLVTKVGRPVDQWTAEDCAELEILFRSLARKEIRRDEAFPPERVTPADLAGELDEPAADERIRPGHTWDPELQEWIPDDAGVRPEDIADGA